jgi:hypothetical protein
MNKMKDGFSHNILPGSRKGQFIMIAVPRDNNLEHAKVLDGGYAPGSYMQTMASDVAEFWADVEPGSEILLVKVIG